MAGLTLKPPSKVYRMIMGRLFLENLSKIRGA
jgi:hypothetical protein